MHSTPQMNTTTSSPAPNGKPLQKKPPIHGKMRGFMALIKRVTRGKNGNDCWPFPGNFDDDRAQPAARSNSDVSRSEAEASEVQQECTVSSNVWDAFVYIGPGGPVLKNR
jgi:hypothetical protein